MLVRFLISATSCVRQEHSSQLERGKHWQRRGTRTLLLTGKKTEENFSLRSLCIRERTEQNVLRRRSTLSDVISCQMPRRALDIPLAPTGSKHVNRQRDRRPEMSVELDQLWFLFCNAVYSHRKNKSGKRTDLRSKNRSRVG